VPPGANPPSFEPAEDARLVERCLAGDHKAWGILVRRHERLVYAIGRSYRLSDEDLGDVFQEVFSALVRGLPRLREPRTLVRWLSSTTQRIARAIALKRRREAALSAPLEVGIATVPAAEPPAGEDLERLEAQAMVRLALGRLSERCRNLLGALYFEDPTPSYEALSRRLGLPIGSLGPTRARCFDRLRSAYESLEAEDEAGINEQDATTFDRGSPGEDRLRSGFDAVTKRPEVAPLEEHP
jgi:RNA polymerase sigma factor (sigma-70 family)